MIQSLEGFVTEQLALLLPIDRAWQPSEYLPDLTAEDWRDRIEALRASARGLPDDLLVALVGGMVTEEALPSYAVALSALAQDPTGTSERGWARWQRGWTAEENRHGDLLNAYLRLSGRVDMTSVERTIHYLLARGFNPKAYPDPYGGLIYTSFQERATAIAHRNLGRLAAARGAADLAAICRRIAGDEARHESFYTQVMGRVVREDPSGAVLAIRAMLRSMIVMPGRLMSDGRDPNLFERFAVVAQRAGVYTARDYAEIITHLVRVWGLADLDLAGEAARARDYLCQQGPRYERLAEAVAENIAGRPPAPFSWLFGRAV